MPKREEKERIVRARNHPGSSSLDLTIPAALCKKTDIREGDLFKVTLVEDQGKVDIRYERIYSSNKNHK